MSIDLIVATQKKVSSRTLDSIGRLLEICEFSSYKHENFADGEYTKNSKFLCSVSGPLDFDLSENAEQFDSFAGINFIYEIGAPSILEHSDLELVYKVTTNIAEMGKGAVYDPQSDTIIFQSDKLKVQRKSKTKRKMIDLLCVDFVLKPICIENKAPSLIEVLKENCPYALPKKIDGSLPRKQIVESLDDFINKWKEIASLGHTGSITWTGKSPLVSADICFRHSLLQGAPERYSVCHELNLCFNQTALNEDSRNQSGHLAEELIGAITAQFNTIYAVAYIARNHKLDSRNNCWGGEEAEYFRLNPGFWAGIPNFPFWLTWFCEEYKLLIKDCCESDKYEAQDLNSGLLLKMSDRPLNKDEVIADYPKFPSEYMIPAKKLPKFERD